MTNPFSSRGTVLDRQLTTLKYPEARVIVLDDNFNTFKHVVNCLLKIIPWMTEEKALEHARKIDQEGSAIVWTGPVEQAELYHLQLTNEGLTMAPLEKG